MQLIYVGGPVAAAELRLHPVQRVAQSLRLADAVPGDCPSPALRRAARPCRASRAPGAFRSPWRDHAPPRRRRATALSSSTDWRSISGGGGPGHGDKFKFSGGQEPKPPSFTASFIGSSRAASPTRFCRLLAMARNLF